MNQAMLRSLFFFIETYEKSVSGINKCMLTHSNCVFDSHGTKCAGVALASNNRVCAVGSAYEASLAGRIDDTNSLVLITLCKCLYDPFHP